MPDSQWTHRLPWTARGPVRLAAGGDVRSGLAKRLGLEAVQHLDVEAEATPWLDGLEIQGRLSAVVSRICGVSLDVFDEVINEPFKVRVAPSGSPNAPAAVSEVIVDLEADDPPEVAPAEGFDLAGYAEESLALALDPFPRKPGVTFAPPAEPSILSPFAMLKDMKDRRQP
jgi:hypothetical protein